MTGKRTIAKVQKQIASRLKEVPEAALFSHVSPDGDCLGSMLALGLALENLGKKVGYYNPGPVPDNLRFLPGAEKISALLPEKIPDTLIFIDCAEAERAFPAIPPEFLQNKEIINIDHHISNNCFGTLNWVDPGAAATGEMLYSLICQLNGELTQDMAINLYTAIITDTGRFSYSNTTSKSFKIAAELVKTGIDLVKINTILFEQKTWSQTKLLHKALSNLELLENGKIAVIVLSLQDFRETGAQEHLTEGLINYARNIVNVEAAALLKELGNNEIKVSFRSNSWLDVNQVAAKFGGGGHIRASGCTLNMPLSQAQKNVVSALKEALHLGRNHERS